MAWQARLVLVRRALAGNGEAWRCADWYGEAGEARSGLVGFVVAWRGLAGQAGLGAEWNGKLGMGEAWLGRHGIAR